MPHSSSSKKADSSHQNSGHSTDNKPQNTQLSNVAKHPQNADHAPRQQGFPQLALGMLKEINRLYAVTRREEKQSRQMLNGALYAAWHAGKLLAAAKAHIRRKAGHGAWIPWVQTYFNGGVRTAQRYMKLARSVEMPSRLSGISLRQAYFRLGIATEPKGAAEDEAAVAKLSSHIMLANRLARVLRQERRRIRLQDLEPLYKQLRALFERDEARKRR